MDTVIELLHRGAELFGEMPWLGEKDESGYRMTSFLEADRVSLAFAAALVNRGFKKGENIAILSEGRTAWVLGEFGILKAGCTSVPLSSKLSADEILFRLDHSESRAVLVSENCFPRLAEVISRTERKPLVICISGKTDSMSKSAASCGLEQGKSFCWYEDLVQEGKQSLDAHTTGSGDKPMTWIMRELEKSIFPDDTVTICYTSGTTGNPKGIMLSHANYIHNAVNASEVVEVKKGWKSLIMLPLDHSFAHTVGIYIFLLKGLTMYFVDARGGPLAALRNLPKNLLEVNPDFLLTVPALSGNFMKKMIQGVAEKGAFVNGIFQRGLKAGIARAGNGWNKPPLSCRIQNWFPWALANALVFPKLRKIFGTDIRFCIGGGALLEIRQQEFFNAIGVPVYQGYGLTENAPIICSNSARKHKFGTSGVIIPNLDVRIMKDENTECAVGEAGQIVTRGGSVMKGYYKNPAATAETLKDGWLWSGDLGYIDRDGFLVVTGREKALLIAADGEKYSPESIEEAVINTSRYINQIMAYNEQCKFTAALVTLNSDLIRSDIKSGTIDAIRNGSLVADLVIDAIMKDLLSFTAHPDYRDIPAQWRPASIAIIPKAFDEEHGLVNSTLKLVRHKVRTHYADRIAELYATGTADAHVEGNRAALRDAGILS